MTSDGTNAFAWDAENRMIKITYPGSNNFSSFVYDGFGRNVSIVETVAGSVTSTKQFVWNGLKKQEERDSSGVLTKEFFALGQKNSATKLFYTKSRPGSTAEMTDNSGVVLAQYTFDPYGRVTKISESVPCDFQFAGYYKHGRSNLDLAMRRSYNSQLGRWINRDPLSEAGGQNLFVYCLNSPITYQDLLGLHVAIVINPNGFPIFGHCAVLVGNDTDGWTYYSNSLGGDSNSGSTFSNLDDFFANGPGGYSRDNSAFFNTDNAPGADAGAAAEAINSINSGYRPATNNCAHTCRDALRGAGVNMPEGGVGNTGWGLTPGEVFQDAQERGGFPAPPSAP